MVNEAVRKAAAVEAAKVIPAEHDGFGYWLAVADVVIAMVTGSIEQRHENEQVRRMRASGVCPACGSEV